MLTLYYAPGSCALATHLALEYAGAGYEAVRVDFRTNEQRSPAYLQVNPKGRVPALVTEQGVLTETPALLVYVAQRWPAAQLAPLAGAFEMARVNEFNAYMCATVHVAHAHGRRPYRWADDAQAQESMKRKMPQNMAECFELVERQLLRGPWVLGERFSICDLYLFTIARWLEADGVAIETLPRVHEHRRRMAQQEVVRRVVAAERPAA